MLNFQVMQLKQFPRRPNETWQGGFVRLPGWVTDEAPKPYRPLMALWVSLQTGRAGPGAEACPPHEKRFSMAVDALVAFATDEAVGGYRPGKLQVNDPALVEHLSGLLAEADIAVEYRPRLLTVDRYLAGAAEAVLGHPPPPGALEGKGVTVERMRAFAEAAGGFLQARPWTHLDGEDLIGIEAPRVDAAFSYAVVLGSGGREFGLGFHSSPGQYWRVHDADDPVPELLGPGGAWSVTFDEITEIPFADADLWEDHGLPVADEKAYPIAGHFGPDGGLRRPSADVLAFFEGLLRAIPAASEEEMDSGRWTKKVQTFDGPVEYALSLPFLLNPLGHKELYEHGFSDRRAMELMHSQIDRFLEEKSFDSIEKMNEAIRGEFVGKPLDPTRYKPRNAFEQAQDLCYQAFDSIGRRKTALARKALNLCGDCADACVILAERSPTPEKASAFYVRGVQAGRRALGEDPFREYAGEFWSAPGTKPFMRALFGLAESLSALGRGPEAVSHYQELLRLNPGDNQGARYALLPLLIAENADAAAEDLLGQYKGEVQATWRYCRALLAFRREGDAPGSRRRLAAALKANPHVPKYLLGEAEPSWPAGYQIGSEEEAVVCVRECRRPWEATDGALDWLAARALAARKPRPRRPRKTRRPKKR